MKEYKTLSPFKLLMLQNFPYIEADFDALTNYQLMCKIVEYLNNVINNQIAVQDNVTYLYDEFVKLKSFVDNYFDNLDVQDDINNKLDVMAQDGTLAQIINEQIFNDLNNRVTNLENNINSIAYNNIFLGVFFDNDSEMIHFLTSLDGQNWSEFNKEVVINGRDPQLTYNENNKTFYLALTQSSGVDYDFICYTSDNFVDWTQRRIDLGIHNGLRWSPELFFDNDKLYALISNGTSEDSMQVYISECNSIENLTFNNARKLNLNLDNVIDANLIKYNNLYYLTVKDNTTSKQLIYTSTDLLTFEVVNDNVLGYDIPCEGGQLLNINDRWYFYGDTWQSYHNYAVMQTDTIENFGFIFINKSLKYMRHGSVCYLTDKKAVSLITSLTDYSNVTRIIETESQILLNGEYENLIVYPNYMYRINGNTTINNIENPYNLQFMPFVFTTNIKNKLTINKINNKNKNLVINNSTYENEKLKLINLQGDNYISNYLQIKNITQEDLLTINNTSEYEFTLYKSELRNNRLYLNFKIIKLIQNPTTHVFTLKSPYLPVNQVPINNDKGKTMYIRENGTLFGDSNNLLQNEATYCFTEFEIK